MNDAGRVDFVINQGSDFFVEIYWTDGSGTPIPAVSPMRMEIRAGNGQLLTDLFYNDSPGPGDPVTSGILFNVDSGLIQLDIGSEKTTGFAPGLYNYDLFVTYSDGQLNPTLRKHRLIYGTVEVMGRTTKNV